MDQNPRLDLAGLIRTRGLIARQGGNALYQELPQLALPASCRILTSTHRMPPVSPAEQRTPLVGAPAENQVHGVAGDANDLSHRGDATHMVTGQQWRERVAPRTNRVACTAPNGQHEVHPYGVRCEQMPVLGEEWMRDLENGRPQLQRERVRGTQVKKRVCHIRRGQGRRDSSGGPRHSDPDHAQPPLRRSRDRSGGEDFPSPRLVTAWDRTDSMRREHLARSAGPRQRRG